MKSRKVEDLTQHELDEMLKVLSCLTINIEFRNTDFVVKFKLDEEQLKLLLVTNIDLNFTNVNQIGNSWIWE